MRPRNGQKIAYKSSRLSNGQIDNVNHGNSATGAHNEPHTPNIGNVEIFTLSLLGFESLSLVRY